MVIAPYDAGERRWCVNSVRVGYGHVVLFMFAFEFCDEVKFTSTYQGISGIGERIVRKYELLSSACYCRSMIKSRGLV